MDIAALSMAMSQASVVQSASLQVMSITKDMAQQRRPADGRNVEVSACSSSQSGWKSRSFGLVEIQHVSSCNTHCGKQNPNSSNSNELKPFGLFFF